MKTKSKKQHRWPIKMKMNNKKATRRKRGFYRGPFWPCKEHQVLLRPTFWSCSLDPCRPESTWNQEQPSVELCFLWSGLPNRISVAILRMLKLQTGWQQQSPDRNPPPPQIFTVIKICPDRNVFGIKNPGWRRGTHIPQLRPVWDLVRIFELLSPKCYHSLSLETVAQTEIQMLWVHSQT